jgi:hypothetical protein
VNRLVEHGGTFKMLDFEASMVTKAGTLRGAWSWVEVAKRDEILRGIIEGGFTHHVSIIHSSISAEMKEFCKYAGIQYVSVP